VNEHQGSASGRSSGRSSERSGDGYRFPRTYFRFGYDPADVDALVKRIKATLNGTAAPGHAVTAAQVRAAQFGRARMLSHGYDMESVDNALDAYVEKLSQL
jgi:DivIVA domain-containing protein